MINILTPSLTFTEAWPVWFRGKAQTISEGSIRAYREYRPHLEKFFGKLKLSEITIDHIIEYREQRRKSAGPALVNHEVNAVGQILRQLDLWEPIKKHFKQLKVPKGSGVGYRLTNEELQHLAEVAQLSPYWRVAYLCMLIQAQTAAGPTEVLSVRLGDIDWDNKRLHIQGTKTEHRPRKIPMTDDCFMAVKEAELRAREKGSVLPEHYLFPHQRRKGAHALSYHTAWYGIRREASKKFPNLAKVRIYDLRHTVLSLLAENPNIDKPTLNRLAGHGPGSKMVVDVYFHADNKRKQEAVSVLNGITRKKAQPLFSNTKRQPRALPLTTEETDPLEVLRAGLEEEAS